MDRFDIITILLLAKEKAFEQFLTWKGYFVECEDHDYALFCRSESENYFRLYKFLCAEIKELEANPFKEFKIK